MIRPFRTPTQHDDTVARYTIGEVGVSLRSDLVSALDGFDDLYRGTRTAGLKRLRRDQPSNKPSREIRMEVRKTARSRFSGTRYRIFGDGEPIGKQRKPQEVLPFLEWGVNWRVIQTRGEFLQIHAATMAHQSGGCIFAATSGGGKSTLAASLLARGWKYYSDEFALIHRRTLQLHAFPKALCIKAGAFAAMQELGLPLAGGRHYVKGIKGKVSYINPHDVGNQPIAQPGSVRFIVFPTYLEGAEPRWEPVPRARAVFALAAGTLNRHAFDDGGLSLLRSVVAGAACYAMQYGNQDDSCRMIESFVGSPASAPAASP